MSRIVKSLALALALVTPMAQAGAQAVNEAPMVASGGQPGFAAFLQVLAARARAEGVREDTIHAVIDTLTYDPDVV